jgi:dihydrofolate synthase/folylpolyglutamate synthase
VVARLKDRIDHWHVGPTPGARGLPARQMAEALRAAGAAEGAGRSMSVHQTLTAAYEAALGQARPDDRIIVFGSFTTVAAVMQWRSGQRAHCA